MGHGGGWSGHAIPILTKGPLLATFIDPFNSTLCNQPFFAKHQNTAFALWENLLKNPEWNVWFYRQKMILLTKTDVWSGWEKNPERKKKTKANKTKEEIPVWLPSHPHFFDMEADSFPLSENNETNRTYRKWEGFLI